MVTDFTQFRPWTKALDLSLKIHTLTEKYPKREMFELVSQMRRASLSVAANIAEGFGRYSYPDKRHKYIQARGELVELMTFLHYSSGVHYISSQVLQTFLDACTEVHKMLNSLIKKMGTIDADLSLKS